MLIVLRFHELTVANGNIIRRLHLNTLSALLHDGGRHIEELSLPRVGGPKQPGDAPQGTVQVSGAVPDSCRLIESFAESRSRARRAEKCAPWGGRWCLAQQRMPT